MKIRKYHCAQCKRQYSAANMKGHILIHEKGFDMHRIHKCKTCLKKVMSTERIYHLELAHPHEYKKLENMIHENQVTEELQKQFTYDPQ